MKNIGTFLLLIVCLQFVYGQQNWKVVNVKGTPEKRHECAFVEVNDKFYLVGGRGVKPVNEYNPETRSWKTMAEPPLEMHHFQALEYNNKLYVIGALTGEYPNEKPIPQVYIFDPAQDKWTKGAEIPEARQRGAAGVVLHNDIVYLVCGIVDGHNGDFVPWMDSWDPKTDEWIQLPDAPNARDHFQAAIVGDKIVAAGGRTTSASTNEVLELTLEEVDYFDINTQKWHTAEKGIPTQRAGTASISYGNQVIVLGGESATQKSAHNEVESFNFDKGIWQILPNLIRGRHGTQAILYNQKIYMVAGSGNRGGGPELNSMEMLNLE